jgi:hypothetical protein
MPIFQEFTDAVANENLKVCASWPSQRLTTNTMDYDRARQQMADNSVERQNTQNRDYHLLSARMMKDVVEPDIESATAYKEIANGISPTSQGYHFANQMQQIQSATTVSIHQLQSTLSSMNTMLAQLVGLVK